MPLDDVVPWYCPQYCPSFCDMPWLHPTSMWCWAEHPHIEMLSCATLLAKCSHTGLVPFNLHRAAPVGIPGPKVPGLVQSHPARMWPSRGSRPVPPAGSPTLSPKEGSVCVGGGTRASEVQPPEDSCPVHSPPQHTLRLLGGGEGKAKAFTLGAPVAAAGKATLSSRAPSLWAVGPAQRCQRCLLFPAPCLLCHSHLADCLPKDLPFRKMGGAGRGWRAGSPLLPGFQVFCITEEGHSARKRHILQPGCCPSGAWPRPRTACDFAVLGLTCLACQGGSGSSSWTVSKEQERSPEPLCWALALGHGGEGQCQWDFCVAGAEEHMAQAGSAPQRHLCPSLPWSCLAWLRPSPFPPVRRACLVSAGPCPASSAFQMNRPQELEDFFPSPARPSACPLENGLPILPMG